MKNITNEIVKKPASDVAVNMRCDSKTYSDLKAKLKKNDLTVKAFLMAAIKVYLAEK